MRLAELLDTVTSSSVDDWHRLTPSTLSVVRTVDPAAAEIELVQHPYLAHYKSNLDIGMQWGIEQREWQGVWTEWSPFPDQSVSGEWLEVTFQGRPVYRQLVVSADGGRYLLPAPHARTQKGDPPHVTGWWVESAHIPFVRLAHQLSCSDDFEDGLRSAAFEIVQGA